MVPAKERNPMDSAHLFPAAKGKHASSIASIAIFVLGVAVVGFHSGYCVGLDTGLRARQHAQNGRLMKEVHVQGCVCCDKHAATKGRDRDAPSNDDPAAGSNSGKADFRKPRFPDSMRHFAVGMSRVPRDDFARRFDAGVPLKTTEPGNEQVLILYGHVDAQPTNSAEQQTTTRTTQSQGDVPLITSISEATANCDFLNVILTNANTNMNYGKKQCVALMGQSESAHVQKWARLPSTGTTINSTAPLQFVGRLMELLGADSDSTPFVHDTRKHWDFLHDYIENIDALLDKLRPLAEQAVRNNTLVVMFSNFGQAELIINFCASARARNLELSGILLYATDLETRELAEGLGMTAFYDEATFGRFPSMASEAFADPTFFAMMKAKVMCLQMTSMLGYDILFQDADVIWYKDPLPYFHNNELPYADVLFADDGSELPTYLPYKGNGGFFYLRNNRKTMYLLNSLLLLSDSNGGNEQFHLNQLMAEHASLYGLKVKVLPRTEFPTGVVFHRNFDIMKGIFDGSIKPFMFHMSWTHSKKGKLLNFKQMGEWYVEERCIGSNATTILNSTRIRRGSLISPCCSAQPFVSCHYGNKPSLIRCNTSHVIPLGANERSFW